MAILDDRIRELRFEKLQAEVEELNARALERAAKLSKSNLMKTRAPLVLTIVTIISVFLGSGISIVSFYDQRG